MGPLVMTGVGCEFCPAKFHNLEMLKAHKKFCNYSIINAEEIEQEVDNKRRRMVEISSENKIFSCPICNSSFKLKKQFDEHVKKEHIQKTPAMCPNCKRTFKLLRVLKAHIRMKKCLPSIESDIYLETEEGTKKSVVSYKENSLDIFSIEEPTN